MKHWLLLKVSSMIKNKWIRNHLFTHSEEYRSACPILSHQHLWALTANMENSWCPLTGCHVVGSLSWNVVSEKITVNQENVLWKIWALDFLYFFGKRLFFILIHKVFTLCHGVLISLKKALSDMYICMHANTHACRHRHVYKFV